MTKELIALLIMSLCLIGINIVWAVELKRQRDAFTKLCKSINEEWLKLLKKQENEWRELCIDLMKGDTDVKGKMLSKVKRALDLQAQMARLNKEIKEIDAESKKAKKELNAELKKAKAEYLEIMDDPYIYDKVNGLKYDGIL